MFQEYVKAFIEHLLYISEIKDSAPITIAQFFFEKFPSK